MSTDHVDPVDWSVDDVVNFLCRPGPAPWSQSSNTPRPEPTKLEAALRENDMCGEVLMHVDNDGLKDLGVTAYGHRISLMKAVRWLQNQSPKYKLSEEADHMDERPDLRPNSDVKSHSGAPLSLSHATLVPIATNPITTVPSQPSKEESDTVVKGQKAKRRVAPILVQQNTPQISSGQPLTSDNLAPLSEPFQPPEISRSWLENDALLTSRTQKEEDFLDYLTRKYPPHGDEDGDSESSALPQYGESGSEAELDVDTWNEIVEENPSLDVSSSSQISGAECESIIGQYISNREKIWHQERLPKELPDARGMWMFFRQLNKLQNEKDRLSANIEHLSSRLNKLQEGILRVEYRSPQVLQKACKSLDMTISDRCFDQWRLSILESDVCPQKVSRPVKAPRPRKKREVESGDDETLSSESDESFSGDSIAEDLLSDGDQIEQTDIEQVDLGHDSLSHVSISSGDEDIQAQPKQPRSDPTRGLPFSLGSSPPSSAGESPPSKRQRTMETDRDHNANAPPTTGPTAFFQDEDIDLPDMDVGSIGDSARPSSASRTVQPPQDQDHDMGGILIETPPLNPTSPTDNLDGEPMVMTPPLNPISPTDNLDGELMVTTPPLNPTQPVKLALSHSRRPEAHPDRPSPSSRRSSFAQPITIGDSSSVQSAFSPKSEDKPAVDTELAELFESLEKTPLDTIMAEGNRIHLLAKSVMQLRSSELKDFGPFLNQWFPEVYAEQVQEAIRAMMKNKRELPGNDPTESKLFMRLGALFVSWFHCITLNPSGMPPNLLRDALAKISPEDRTTFDTFIHKFKELIDAYNKWNPNSSRRRSSGGQSTDANSPNDDDWPDIPSQQPVADPNHLKRKKRHMMRFQTNVQSFARDRKAKQDRAREAFRKERERLGLSNSDPAGQAVSFKEPIIYLNPMIGEFVKPHQLLGIQFMWRELCEADNAQGCLLAHVMGLGKTMQVISLLITIAEAAASENPQIRAQVPSRFHRSQTLILCPASLAQNWLEELDFWVPRDHHLGSFYDITPSFTPDPERRLAVLETWKSKGGILILSYEMFRRLLNHNGSNGFDEKQQKIVEEVLLSTPNIVVADEAHKLKSDVSATAKVASRIKTASRIAMTGSPLANNLMEYFQMIDWIAPGYLETPSAFKEKFIEPIQTGLYLDSTRSQRRAGLVALKLLNGILEPKVNRAGMSAIASDLPIKTEFILRVPLSELQKTAYNIFVEEIKSKGNSTNLWQWLAILQLCCNHPVPFLSKLKDRTKQKDDADTASLLTISEGDLPPLLSERIEALFKTVPDLSDPSLSHRALLLGRILEESQRVGDKVLVFSQSIPTVNYLETFLKQRGWSFKRITGATPVHHRQQMVKSFNSNDDTQIMLISTRAGGLGLNMYGANRVIIFDFLFNPTWEEQAIGRAYRMGQKKPVFVYRFVASGTFEDVIHNKVVFKSQLSVRVVDKKNVRRESKKDTDYLFLVQQKDSEPLDHALGKDPEVLDRIIRSDDASSILGVTLSTLQDDENDRLTQQEHEEVQDKLSLDLLRRTDPRAYASEIDRREQTERATREAVRRRFEEAVAQSHMTNHHLQPSMPQAVPSQQFIHSQQPDPTQQLVAHQQFVQSQQPDPTQQLVAHQQLVQSQQPDPAQRLVPPQQFVPAQQPEATFQHTVPPNLTVSTANPLQIPLDNVFLRHQQGINETQMRQAEMQTEIYRAQWLSYMQNQPFQQAGGLALMPQQQQLTDESNYATDMIFLTYSEDYPLQMYDPSSGTWTSNDGAQDHAPSASLQDKRPALAQGVSSPTENYTPPSTMRTSLQPESFTLALRGSSPTENYVPPGTMSTSPQRGHSRATSLAENYVPPVTMRTSPQRGHSRATSPTENYIPPVTMRTSPQLGHSRATSLTENYVPPVTMCSPTLPSRVQGPSSSKEARPGSSHSIASTSSTMFMDISVPSELPSPTKLANGDM